jgi:hypothetical protein
MKQYSGLFTETLLEFSISIGSGRASMNYSYGKSYKDERIKILAFLLYTAEMIWIAGTQGHTSLRLQMRHILENPPQEGMDRAWPITFASIYAGTGAGTMELGDKVENPIIIFGGKVVENGLLRMMTFVATEIFVIRTTYSSPLDDRKATLTQGSALIFWQDLMNTISKDNNEKLISGLKILLDYFDAVQNEKWSVNISVGAVRKINKMIFDHIIL